MNPGKQFEQNIKASIPKEVYCLRLRDGTGNFAGQKNENVRFQHFNPCDMLIHYQGILFLAELKSHKGKSIPFSCIRDSQLRELSKVSGEREIAVMLLNFRDLEETYLIDFKHIESFITINKANDLRKSFPLDYIREYGIKIDQQKKKVNYKYNIIDSLEKLLSSR